MRKLKAIAVGGAMSNALGAQENVVALYYHIQKETDEERRARLLKEVQRRPSTVPVWYAEMQRTGRQVTVRLAGRAE